MTEVFSLLYSTLVLIAFVSFVWGVGSAMMNGTRGSSMGACLVIAGVSGLLAAACFQIIQ